MMHERERRLKRVELLMGVGKEYMYTVISCATCAVCLSLYCAYEKKSL